MKKSEWESLNNTCNKISGNVSESGNKVILLVIAVTMLLMCGDGIVYLIEIFAMSLVFIVPIGLIIFLFGFKNVGDICWYSRFRHWWRR